MNVLDEAANTKHLVIVANCAILMVLRNVTDRESSKRQMCTVFQGQSVICTCALLYVVVLTILCAPVQRSIRHLSTN